MDKLQAEQIVSAVADKIKSLEAEVELLTGKENKKARNGKARDIADLKRDADFIDAERILAGKEPLAEHNKVKVEEEKVEEEKVEDKVEPEKKKKEKKVKEGKVESAGISPAERKELEDLKQQLIARKTELKAEGMSGGQMNKEPQIVQWVARMNELKEKAGELTDKKADKKAEKKGKKGNSQEAEALKVELEAYKIRLKDEFGYTKGDINKDEDVLEMTKKLKGLTT